MAYVFLNNISHSIRENMINLRVIVSLILCAILLPSKVLAEAYYPNTMTEVVTYETNRIASSILGLDGGIVKLENVGAIEFPKNSFASTTTVTLKPTASPEITQLFIDTAFLFGSIPVFTNSVKIGTGLLRPKSDAIKTRLRVPDVLKKEVASGARLEIFAGIEQGSANEGPYTAFDILDSVFNETTGELEFELFPWAFAQNHLTEGEYQAILVMAVITKK